MGILGSQGSPGTCVPAEPGAGSHTVFTTGEACEEIIARLSDVDLFLAAKGEVRKLRLFHTADEGVTEVVSRLAEYEADVQTVVEAHMEKLLGVRFLASEYSTGPVHGGRIDSPGLDENGAPCIIEYKRGTDVGVFSELPAGHSTCEGERL